MSAACRGATRCCICSKNVRTAGRSTPSQFDRGIRQAVLDIVKRQVDVGIDIVSDGETSKISYATYVHDRLTGFSDEGSTEGAKPHADLAPFPDLRRKMAQLSGARRFKRVACVGPIAVGNRRGAGARPRQYARRRRCRAAGRGIFDRGLSRRGRELSAEHLLSQPRGLCRGHRRGDAGRVRRHCGGGFRAANRLPRSGDVAAHRLSGSFGDGVFAARRLPRRSAEPCARQYSSRHGPYSCLLGQLRRPAHPRHRARQDRQDRPWRKGASHRHRGRKPASRPRMDRLAGFHASRRQAAAAGSDRYVDQLCRASLPRRRAHRALCATSSAGSA